jgi:uncharacterized protein (TIGR00730 family)
VTRSLDAVCVYCGSSPGVDPAYAAAAEAVGRLLAEAGITLVFGGSGIGLMGAMADAAMAAGGRVVGVIPKQVFKREVAHRRLTELIEVDSMHARKLEMFERADAFVALPGGLGTFEELFEMATWGQLGLHRKPVVTVDVLGFWEPMYALLDQAVAAGFMKSGNRALITAVGKPDELLDALRAYAVPYTDKWIDLEET